MYNQDKPETAREKAARIWHNNRITRESKSTDQEPQEQIHHAPTLRREILGIMAEKNKQTLAHYVISINQRHIKLLKEKLRRLRAEQTNE